GWLCQSLAALSGLAAAIGLEAIAVRIDDEGGVVVGAVVAAQAWGAVVVPADAQRGGVEGVDTLAARRVEALMQAGFVVRGHRPLGGADPQRDRVPTIAERARRLAEAGIAQRLQGRVVEAFGLGHVADAERDVVDHGAGLRLRLDR